MGLPERGCPRLSQEAPPALRPCQAPCPRAHPDCSTHTHTHTLPLPPQGVAPAEGSVIDLLIRSTDKATGKGLTDVQVAAQVC